MYCKTSDKIAFNLAIKVSQLEFPPTARKKIAKGILSQKNLHEWDELKKKIDIAFSDMMMLINRMIREEEFHRVLNRTKPD